MRNSAKRQAVADFINGEELIALEGVDDGEETLDTSPPEPLDEEWLTDIRERRRRLAADPDGELAIYRAFYQDPTLDVADVQGLLDGMELAVGRPEDFYDFMSGQEGLLDTLRAGGRVIRDLPRHFPTRRVRAEQQHQIDALRATYGIDDDIVINPNDHHFETSDPGWWPLFKEKFEEMSSKWPGGLAAFIGHDADHSFVYDDTRGADTIALMSDFGVGQYQALCIARQLEKHRPDYVFHLGDVYYGGSSKEFDERYARPLDEVMNHSLLFSLPENHELYGEGKAYQQFLARECARGRIVQNGSYFCVRFPKHQVIGIDVNWNGRQRFQHAASRAWLRELLVDDGDRTTILLSGSAPYEYGKPESSKLHDDLREWTDAGEIDLWFWGDNHYCALFERDPEKANFVGSCIGHGGYPGHTKTRDAASEASSYVGATWFETEPRFPRPANGPGLRDDMLDNGWCQLTMLGDGGVELLYVDWLGCKRFRARYTRSGAPDRHLELTDTEEFGRTTLHAP